MTLELIVLALLFGLDAFFSAAEIAMTSLSRYKLEELAERHPSYAELLNRFRHNPSRLLTTIIISSNLTVIAFSSVATTMTLRHQDAGGNSAMLAQVMTILLSVVTVLLAEIAPKILAKRHSERVAEMSLPGLRLTEILLGPLVRLIVGTIRWMTKPFGGGDVAEMPVVTEEELVRLVDEGARGGVIEKEESEMIQSIIEFGDTVVREVMIPRTEMMGIPLGTSVEQCQDIFIDAGYSRMPVYDESFDKIKGIIYAKDFLSMLKERELIILQDIIRPAYFVPETKKVSDLLREFKKGKIHLAIVVDEYGGTAGLVTMEDLVEEIVGDIKDEYDFEAQPIHKLADGHWEVDASADIHEFSRELDVEIPDNGESTTVAGFVAEQFNKIPAKGEKMNYHGVEIEVSAASETRVERIRIRRLHGH